MTMLRSVLYFTPRMAGYGLLAGTFFGMLIYPLFGAGFGAPIGLAAGIALGLIMGIGVPIYERIGLEEDVSVDEYASRLALGTGLFATILAALPLAFIFAPVAGFSAAYVAHHYAYERSTFAGKRKNEYLGIDHHQRRSGVVRQLSSEILKSSFYVTVPAAALFFLVSTLGGTILAGIGLGMFTLAWGAGFAGVIGLINGFFILFLNRLFFDPELTKQAYKQRVVAIVGVLTLFLSSIVTLGFGAPFAAIAAGFAAHKYADWYYDAPEKQKRGKRKNAQRLALHDDNLADDWLDEDFSDEEDEAVRLR